MDATLRPWLLEVNGQPSLTGDTPLDYKVKSTVLADLLNMIGVRHDRASLSEAAARYRAPSPSYWLRGRNKADAAKMYELLNLESQQEYERRRGWVRAFPFAGGVAHKPLFGITRDINMHMCRRAAEEQ